MKRPILYVLVFFCTGTVFAGFLQIPVIYPILLGAAFCIFSVAVSKNRVLSHLNLYLAIIFLGIACYENSNTLAPDHIANFITKQPKVVYLKGTIADDPVTSAASYDRQKTSFMLKASFLKEDDYWKKVSGLVRVDAYSNKTTAVAFGDEIAAEGFISKPFSLRNPGSFDYSKYLELKNIYAVFKIKEAAAIAVTKKKDAGRIKKIAYILKHFIRDSLNKYLSEPYRGFTKAILIGDRASLGEGLKDDFVETGTAHVLAISGLHVGLIAAIIFAVFGLAGIPKKFNLVLTVCVLIVYSFTAGSSPPIVRAVIIYAVFVAGYLLKRDSDSLNSLSIAALLILLWNPKELFDPSFQLSFVSVAGIIVLYPKLKKMTGFDSYFAKAVLVSSAALIGTWPIVAVYFNIISPVAFIANLVIIPSLFVIMAVVLTFLPAAAFSSELAGALAFVLQLAEQAIFYANRLLSDLPFSYFRVKAPSVDFLILYYGFIALSISPMPLRLGRIKIGMKEAVIALLLAVNILVWKENVNSASRFAETVFFDVGQGDSIFMKLPGGRNILIDGGPARKDAFDAGRSVIAPYLWNNGVSYIDAVIATHFHDDHLGGLLYILKNFKIGCVIDNGAIAGKSGIYDRYIDIIKKRHIRHLVTGEGDILNFGTGAEFYVLNPPKGASLADSNDNSLVLKFVYKNFSILLCGDITAEPMERMINSYGEILKSDIIKIPHHGGVLGDESMVTKFLNNVAPRASIISGETSRHKSDYKTAEDGAVTVITDSGSFKIKTFTK